MINNYHHIIIYVLYCSNNFVTPDKKLRSLHVDTEKKVLKKVLKQHKKRYLFLLITLEIHNLCIEVV